MRRPLALLAGLLPLGAWAGEPLSLAYRAAAADGLAEVEVRFGPKATSPARVRVLHWLHGAPSAALLVLKTSECLPDASRLQYRWRWMEPDVRRTFDGVLKEGGYRAVVFLQQAKGGQWHALCGTEALGDPRWLTTHPEHAAYRAEAQRLIADPAVRDADPRTLLHPAAAPATDAGVPDAGAR